MIRFLEKASESLSTSHPRETPLATFGEPTVQVSSENERTNGEINEKDALKVFQHQIGDLEHVIVELVQTFVDSNVFADCLVRVPLHAHVDAKHTQTVCPISG